jgi:hypothetical protein
LCAPQLHQIFWSINKICTCRKSKENSSNVLSVW